MNEFHFNARFKDITGHEPLAWQSRMYHNHFASGALSGLEVIDLPTGLGKTMVMAIWLIAREFNEKLPRRLIYVVDRRTVIDQATELAMQLRGRFGEGQVEISTLRGQLADNVRWSRDPSKPAIIIGTVDLIGSALLFSGYRSSFKRRPLEAGLLGQDSLLVLDEAHLSKPFEKLITSISSFQSGQGMPMKVIRMSATSGQSPPEKQFSLAFDQLGNLTEDDGKDKIVAERWNSRKTLSILTLGDKERLTDKLADAASQLANDTSVVGKRIVVFVRKPEDARAIADSIRRHSPQRAKTGPYGNSVEILTGTMRGLERDELVQKPVFKERWLNGSLEPSDESNQAPAFLISTSAGEVGIDLNADHMVCDAAPIDSMIQRLGRVNRRGKGNATIQLFVVPPKEAKDAKPKKLKGLELSIANTIELLRTVIDVSPKNIATVRTSDGWKDKYAAACSPEPTMVVLTEFLLDAWSMTSIAKQMPGRPEVGPWLRGIADELPQTTIAWREELDLPGFDQLDLDDIEEWFDTHRVLTHETLSVPTHAAAKWFTDRWAKLTEIQQHAAGPRPLIINRAGSTVSSVIDLVDQLSRKGGDATAIIRNAYLILPASFGGIERGKGMLNAESSEVRSEEDKLPVSPDVADHRGRCRQLFSKTEDGDLVVTAVGSGTIPSKAAKLALDLGSDDVSRVQLISYVPRQEKLEYGVKVQSLSAHIGLVRKHVNNILDRLELADSIKNSVKLAVEFHDHGKNRDRWQRTVKGHATPAGQPWSDDTLGKSGAEMTRDPRGYRHEFGSLREFIDAHEGKIDAEVFELAIHLIAVHHGRGRPHFPKGGFDPDAEHRSPEIHIQLIRRFARLQRKYGWWQLAWLENLLRCADALASSDPVTTTNEEGQP